MLKAGKVFLVWGINGWNVVPEATRLAGTMVKDALMLTPIVLEGDAFVAKIQMPSGATIDHGFLITKTRSGAVIEVWDANGDEDYHTIAAKMAPSRCIQR